MSAEIFKFPSNVSRREFARHPQTPIEADPIDNRPPPTESVRNERLRLGRREAWQMAAAATSYWDRRIKFGNAVSYAQKMGVAEGRLHPKNDWWESRPALVEKYRAALVRQLLTPAPEANSVKWKQTKLASEHYLPVKPEQIERSIADDLAFLAAHPTRRSNSEAMARSRVFKEAMRQRIRGLVTSHGFSDEDIKAVLKLKHEEVGRFAEVHGVNIGWMLEGIGPIFKNRPSS
jgi:hypothetical protein